MLDLIYSCFQKILVRNIRLDASSDATNSDSVMVFMFSFFCDMDMISPFPIVNVAPVFDFKSKCTANNTSIYRFRQKRFSNFNVIYNYWVPTRYFISLSSLFQYTLSGCFTLVHKTSIVGWIFGLDILHKNKPLSTIIWNNYALLLFGGLLLSTFKIFLVTRISTHWDFWYLLEIHQSCFSHTFTYQFLLLPS